MNTITDLQKTLQRIDRKGYKAYKSITGSYRADFYTLFIDHVQGDPFAAPSRIRAVIPQKHAGFPADTFAGRSREIALRDFLTRRFSEAAHTITAHNKSAGKSGRIGIDSPGQEILERSSAWINDREVELRITLGLPAFGRTIDGQLAQKMIMDQLPRILYAVLFRNLNSGAVYRHVETAEDADALRGMLQRENLIGFVASGAILPRRSGIDDRPMSPTNAIPFEPPQQLARTFSLPNGGEIRGMGIPRGVTLIVGGGYHGKSTLLRALERGVYNHIPGDGREFVITDRQAVKIRAEDGRRIEKTGIDPFISNLPRGIDTHRFSSDDASGSTSQAANIIEALEAGASALLIDEDTSATNFMIRDHRMQELVAKNREPITPFIDKVRQLYTQYGVSTILVIGGSGDYFDVADTVIRMDEYRPEDVTEQAQQIARKYRLQRSAEGGESFGPINHRVPLPGSLDPSRGNKAVKVAPRGLKTIQFGREDIDLNGIDQLVDTSQTRAIGESLVYLKRYMHDHLTVKELLDRLEDDIRESGIDCITPGKPGDLAEIRGVDVAAALNRLRSLRIAS
ncbi:ABC-ATPase domain-containing protein [Chitinispirillales bacterium ANBcel5]|uniref:ABC-ATPase domain-containing protein n=1 Tax=Cellulosispirillum alkaliphilum TaxID=3039283 RepID=UPI002A567BD0|nr:ABC-ATPase domain-containing protein [Chitinispirillales bacterium ANBcel5]